MYGRSVGIVAICALGTSALVIPSATTGPDAHNEGLRPSLSHPVTRHKINIPCHSCDFPMILDEDYDYDEDDMVENDEDLAWTQSNTQLTLDFSISKDGRRLQLDGEPIFPSKYFRSSAHGGQPIYVSQSPVERESEMSDSGYDQLPLEVTAFGIVASESTVPLGEAMVNENDGERLFRVQFRITSLDRAFVDTDEVVLHLLRSEEGELEIVSIAYSPEPVDSRPHPPIPVSRPPPAMSTYEGCAHLPAPLCRFRKAMAKKFEALRHHKLGLARPCPGMRGPPDAHHKLGEVDIAGARHHHSAPHHHGPPPPGGFHGHHRHRFLHAIARGAIAVLIPVMAGITTGLLVSLIGLMIGRTVGFLWSRITGRRMDDCYCSSRHGCECVEEGKILLSEADERDPPPVYENAPAYTELHSDAVEVRK